MKHLLSLALVAVLALPAAGQQAGAAKVELAASFSIPDSGGSAPSHAPWVGFTADGARLLAVTSKNDVTVFEAGTRRLLQKVSLPNDTTDGLSLDRTGHSAAWVLKDGTVGVTDLESGKVVARLPKIGARWAALAPDAKTLAVSVGGRVELLDLPRLARRKALDAHEGTVANLAWNPDGTALASVGEDGRLLIHDLKSARTVTLRKPGALHAVAFHPKGDAVVFGGKDRVIWQYTISTRKEEVVSKEQPYWITCQGYSPDGRRVAVGDESCDVWVYTLQPRELLFHGKHHAECWLNSVAWTPDSANVLFGCRPNGYGPTTTVWAANFQSEAARAPDVCQSRDALSRAVDELLPKVKEDETRRALATIRQALTVAGSPLPPPPTAEESAPRPEGRAVSTTGVKFRGQEPPRETVAKAEAKPALPGPLGDLLGLGGARKPDGTGSGPTSPDVPKAPPDLAGVSLDKLPKEIQSLVADYQGEMGREMTRLRSSFQINQWRIKD